MLVLQKTARECVRAYCSFVMGKKTTTTHSRKYFLQVILSLNASFLPLGLFESLGFLHLCCCSCLGSVLITILQQTLLGLSQI